jgi:hypothetical protein
MEFALNGMPILSACVDMPLRGAWTADIVVDCDDRDRVLGRAPLDNAAGTWALSGTVRAGDVDSAGKSVLRVVGGAGGLANRLAPRFFRNIEASIVLSDAIDEGGERLAVSSDSDLLKTTLTGWTRMRVTLADEIDALASALDASWRVLSDGTIWIGPETWPADSTAYDCIEDYPHEGRIVIGPSVPSLAPGVTFLGRAVVHVTHKISPSALRTEVLFER